MTRRLVARLFTSVDGVVSAPNMFQFDSFDHDLARVVGSAIAQVDDVILGRVTYQMWGNTGRAPGATTPSLTSSIRSPSTSRREP